MADETITSPGATSVVDDDGTEYLPDPFGRFSVPGPLMTRLLSSGGWHVWTPADAPAFGAWVSLVPTIAEATDGDLFPCFVDIDGGGFGLPPGLAYRTLGASQVLVEGVAAYVTGPTFPDDLAVPGEGTVIAALDDALGFARQPVVSASVLDFESGDPVPAFASLRQDDGVALVVPSVWVSGLVIIGQTMWDVAGS